MLTVEGLRVAYGDIEVVHGLDLEVAAGEAVALIGSNGAGKTAALRAVAGLEPGCSGRVRLAGEEITGLPAHALARRGLVYVPAERRLFGAMTVRENLVLGAHPERPDRDRLARVVELFPRLAERRSQPTGTLSGGEQQMVAVGRALMRRPRLLLLDEPSTGLAPVLVEQVYAAFARLREAEALTVLVAEQQVPAALQLADRAYVLEDGRIQLTGTADELTDDPRVRRAYLGLT